VISHVRAAQLIESVKIYSASASVIIEEQAGIIDERSKRAPDKPDLGACYRLVRWALVATGNALQPESLYAIRTNRDRRGLAAICNEQRRHLLWCRATLDAICRMLQTESSASEPLEDERLALAALIPGLDQSIVLLDPAVLSLSPVRG
jgi:hypothetical protein